MTPRESAVERASSTGDVPQEVGDVVRVRFTLPAGAERHIDVQLIRKSESHLEFSGTGDRVWTVPRAEGENSLTMRPSPTSLSEIDAGTVTDITER